MGKVVQGVGKAALGMIPGGSLVQAGLGLAGGLLGSKTNAFTPLVTQTQNAASPMAGNYANFLNSMMGGQGGAQDAIQNMLAGRPGDPQSLQQYFGAGMGGNGQADLSGVNPAIQPINVGYTPQDIQGQFDPQMLSGDYSGQQFAAHFDPQMMQAQQIASSFAAPQFNAAQLNGLDPITAQQIGFGAPQFQTAGAFQAPQFNTAQLNSLNMQNLGREALATGPNMMQGFGERGNFGSVVNPAANAAAMQQIMGSQDQRNIADLRERFGNQGLSTGAMQAESLYRAEAAPRQALAIDDIMRQNQAQQLQQRGQDIGAWQAGRGFDVQQLGMGGDQSNALNQALIAQRGQDVSQLGLQNQLGLGMNDQQLQAAQMANQFGLGSAQMQNQFGLDSAQMANQFGMQGAGLGLQADQANLQAMLQAAGLNQQGALSLNDQMLQQAGQQNQFNQGNAQFGANLGLQADQANQNAALQAMLGNNQNTQFGAQLGLDAQKLQELSNQFGANFGQNAGMLNNQFSQAAAAQALQAAMANQTNQQTASQQGIQAGGMNNQNQLDLAQMMQSGLLQNQGMGNQWNLGLQNVGLGQQQNQLSAQQSALAQLFGGFNQMAGQGMAQAENVVNPSAGQQFAGGVGAIGSLMNIFNQARNMGQGASQAPAMRGAPAPAMPNFSGLNQQIAAMNGLGNSLMPQQQIPLPWR